MLNDPVKKIFQNSLKTVFLACQADLLIYWNLSFNRINSADKHKIISQAGKYQKQNYWEKIAPLGALFRQSSRLFLMRPDTRLRSELLVPKEGVVHYWQRDQNFRQWDQKLLTEEAKKLQKPGRKTAETGTKNWRNWGKKLAADERGCRPKSTSTEEVRSAGMGLLIETPLCVAPMCVVVTIWSQNSKGQSADNFYPKCVDWNTPLCAPMPVSLLYPFVVSKYR